MTMKGVAAMNPWDNPTRELLQPFFNEPDYWRSCAYGFHVQASRSYEKAWCGYVGVPKSHPLYGYDDRDMMVDIDVIFDCPGGITWSADHAPLHCRDGNWWFGFDCIHCNDLSPKNVVDALAVDGRFPYGVQEEYQTYRDLKFVKYSIYKLARQLSEYPNIE